MSSQAPKAGGKKVSRWASTRRIVGTFAARKVNDIRDAEVVDEASLLAPDADAGTVFGRTVLQQLRRDVKLVDARWIRRNYKDGAPPYRQIAPPDAFFTGELDNNVIIIVLSYPWARKYHPDPRSWFYRLVGQILERYLEWVDQTYNHTKRVAVFWDWMSLYQAMPRDRSAKEEESYQRAMRTIHIWYASPETEVWLLTKSAKKKTIPRHTILSLANKNELNDVPPRIITNCQIWARRFLKRVYENALEEPYENRGWCIFHQAVAEMASAQGVLDIGKLMDKGGGLVQLYRVMDSQDGWHVLDEDAYRRMYDKTAGEIVTVVKTCRASPALPLTPEAFGLRIDSAFFVRKEDAAKAKHLYAITYAQFMQNEQNLNLMNCNIQDTLENLSQIISPHATQLQKIDLPGNNFKGAIDLFAPCVSLKHLCVSRNKNVFGQLNFCEALKDLEALDVSFCDQIVGKLNALGRCTKLKILKGRSTSTEGYIYPLSRCHMLEEVDLSYCSNYDTNKGLMGSLEPFELAQNLRILILEGIQLEGTLEPLMYCTKLEKLVCSGRGVDGGMQITGSLKPLRKCKALEHLDLSRTTLRGSLAPLRNLKHLKDVQIDGTDISCLSLGFYRTFCFCCCCCL